jgi:hypothetical protein
VLKCLYASPSEQFFFVGKMYLSSNTEHVLS